MGAIAIYLAVSFIIPFSSWALMNAEGLYGSLPYMAVSAAMMWMPAVAAAISSRLEGGRANAYSWMPLIKGNARSYLIAWIMPIPISMLGALLYFLLFPERFTTSLIATMDLPFPDYFLVPAMALITVPAALVNMLFALGEEAGWRGFLYPRLKDRMGRRKALLATGIIWGLWHTPINMAGYNYGLDYPGYPWTGIAAMCIFCIVTGLWCAYLADSTGSIWPPALFHGSINAIASAGMMFLVPGSGMILGPAMSGIIPSALSLLLLIAVIRIRGMRR